MVHKEEQTSDKSLEDRSGYEKALIWAIPVFMSWRTTSQEVDVRFGPMQWHFPSPA